ncbi:MAG: ABC transporter permease [Bacteroidota bacterium]
MDANKDHPPQLAKKFLGWFLRPELLEEVEGDLEERFYLVLEKQSSTKAKLDYWYQILHYLRGFALRKNLFSIFNRMYMIWHNIRLSRRLLLKNKGYAAINIGGLTLGMATAMLITLWIKDELKYDSFHEDLDQLYVVKRHVYSGNDIQTRDLVAWNISDELRSNYPEVKEVAIISQQEDLVMYTDKLSFRETGIWATSSFMNLFSWNLLQGKATEVLDDPSAILISASLAKKYFGSNWKEQDQIIGKVIRHNIPGVSDFSVSGVFEDLPKQSSLQFDFILPMDLYEKQNAWLTNWNNSGIKIFLKTHPGIDGTTLSTKIKDIQNEHIEGFQSDIFLQAYSDQYLFNVFKEGKQAGGRIKYVQIFSIVAILLILIASINYINLATARSLKRAREIGVRKAIGAERRLLTNQFVTESFFVISIAFVLAVALAIVALPAFNAVTYKAMTFRDFGARTLLIFSGIGIVTALIASIYPALYLSSLDAVKVLKGVFRQSIGTTRLRKSLVIFQFAISILLIVGALTIHRQIKYIQNKNLGLDRENVIYTRLEGSLSEQFHLFKEELNQVPGVATVTTTNTSPLEIRANTHSVQWPGKDPNSQISMRILHVNFDFVDVMKMQLDSGRDFDIRLGSDSLNYLVNETAAKVMGFEDPLGQQLSFWGASGKIIGVVKDFHTTSLYNTIEPTIIQLRPLSTSWLYLRTNPGSSEMALAGLEKIHKRLNPQYPFEYRFLDESYLEAYLNEQSVRQLSYYFTVFALIITFLGLMGLSVFSTQKRLKEISIRKVMGAPLANLILLLSKDFLILITVSAIVAIPFAYYLMQDWLNKFAYHTELGISTFLFAGVGTALIVLMVVGFYAAKISGINPVDAMRTEG